MFFLWFMSTYAFVMSIGFTVLIFYTIHKQNKMKKTIQNIFNNFMQK